MPYQNPRLLESATFKYQKDFDLFDPQMTVGVILHRILVHASHECRNILVLWHQNEGGSSSPVFKQFNKNERLQRF